jgi:quercetin 2,3-dioxygenase
MTKNSIREAEDVLPSRPTLEGAGVRLRRAFGYHQVPAFDPFLMLDDFGSDDPADYVAGFPWHPHRGIETVTYMMNGEVEHGDSIGNSGVICSGDIQWMTAGSGIIHQEMPRRWEGRMRGFQLWVNLPQKHKLMDPRYRDIRAEQVPVVEPATGVRIKVIAGSVAGVAGPVQDIVVEPECIDVELSEGAEFTQPVARGHRAFAYVVSGNAALGANDKPVAALHTVLLGDGDECRICAVETAARVLLVSGRPIGEPVAWGGPIVMNTDAELEQAFNEYRRGTFIKQGRDPGGN